MFSSSAPVEQAVACAPARLHHRFRQLTIVSMNIESDRPKFVMVRLPHFHLRHPIKNFARVEIAKNASLKFQQQRRMNRIREIEQNIRSAEALEQLAFGNSDALQRVQVMRIRCRLLVKQTIPPGQSMRPQLPLKIPDL